MNGWSSAFSSFVYLVLTNSLVSTGIIRSLHLECQLLTPNSTSSLPSTTVAVSSSTGNSGVVESSLCDLLIHASEHIVQKPPRSSRDGSVKERVISLHSNGDSSTMILREIPARVYWATTGPSRLSFIAEQFLPPLRGTTAT